LIPFPVPKPTWQQFQSILHSLFTNNYHPEIRISYQDEEGDQITLRTENEWLSAYDFLSTQNLPKITLNIPEYPFLEGPTPQSLYFYVQDSNQQQPPQPIPVNSTNDPLLKKLSGDLPACLEKIFAEGKILPHNLPDWFRPAVNIRKCQNSNEVDMDLNIEELFKVLHIRALFELENNNIDLARKLLHAQSCIGPTNPITLYNLACCEALASRKHEAIEYLRLAIRYGYDKVEHMMGDSDLSCLRGEAAFQSLAHDLTLNAQVKNLKL